MRIWLYAFICMLILGISGSAIQAEESNDYDKNRCRYHCLSEVNKYSTSYCKSCIQADKYEKHDTPTDEESSKKEITSQ